MEDSGYSRTRRTLSSSARLLSVLNLDGPLLVGLGLLAIYGLAILYSASGQSVDTIVRTVIRLALGTAAMLALTHASPNLLRRLNLGLFRFQPSEIMKLAVPMLAAWYLHDRPLPPDWRSLAVLAVIIFL